MRKIIFALFCLLLISLAAFSLRATYLTEYEKYNELIFPTLDDSTYSIYNVNQNVTPGFESDKSDLVLALAPGQTYEGKVAVKNHGQAFDFILESDPFSADAQSADSMPVVSFDQTPVNIGTGEFVFFDYQVSVPVGVAEGQYRSILKSYPPEAFEKKDGSIVYILAVGINLIVDVSDDPVSYQYQDLLSDPGELAMVSVWYELRIMFAVLLGLFCLSFIYKAYKK